MQGVRGLRNEAYFSYVAMTKDEAQHSRWTFYEVVNCHGGVTGQTVHGLHPLIQLRFQEAYQARYRDPN